MHTNYYRNTFCKMCGCRLETLVTLFFKWLLMAEKEA